ncbi:hypothetical protein C343_03740 [Cryptococcus neoformans C23]|uniref:Uncharacterized protein n=2 Tax=Cryptococcus neoformans TaxID=5207 RepID=A0A854QA81_CRYNE|nr:hypothetical protein CNAG_02184 [Cryptococcus neoformans var. grubii H99]AUB25466.1 hypothetical protein CKF44_02184 [Cryptococcus neoformans var. grubii]OWZ31044.1 hypothetical protein C347_03802 [Cryptococcus neoformans var. grubii AD2-60a]OWZ41356.1 hypothetical protein C353_03647 [Cryptococcus neoformans var. grubii AD1-83a]OWZ43145.1 hypothetical protein C343_03740 [Cryptococcus neoformans var. grubii C23]OWZ53988.1 hypothetical protein C368_03742 [Cryptococcus neoformans var. grubii 1|eukprot:XP_012049819.1 hypothetical protein CNAG_02184 [Cryptococcus neoformans var. grubii H99]
MRGLLNQLATVNKFQLSSQLITHILLDKAVSNVVNMPASCKLCHGPLATSISSLKQVECHSTCIQFACPGCIKANKPSFSILNLKNHIYDYHCAECMAEAPTHPLTTHFKAPQHSNSNSTTTTC